MQEGGVIELARQAAAAARAERGRARGAARLPARRRYRGVMRRGDLHVAEIMDAAGLRPVSLGSYATAEEAAYAYDAAARIMHGNKAKPNFPEPPAPPAAAAGGGGAPAAHAGLLPLLGHARMRAPLYTQQPAPPAAAGGSGGVPASNARLLPLLGHARMRTPLYTQQPAPPVGGVVQQAAPAPHFGAPPAPVPCYGGAALAFSQFMYHPAAGPAFAAVAGGSYGAGFYDPGLTASGGGNGGGFYGMAPMIGAEPEVPMLTYAASSALSSSDNKNKAILDASAAAEPKLVMIIESDFDGESVVEDNFTVYGGASTSSAARPAVPPIRLKDLMEAEVVRRVTDEWAP